jgi:molecular chaperone GrpE (heat shock protein)
VTDILSPSAPPPSDTVTGETSTETPAPAVPVEPTSDGLADPLAGTVSALAGRIDALDERLRESVAALGEAAARLADSEAECDEQRRLREALLERLEAARSTFQFQLLRPLVTRVATLFDLVGDWQRRPPQTPEEMARCMGILMQQVRDTLELHGIEVVNPQPGDAFDRRFHHVIDTRSTSEAGEHEHVAETLQQGFVFHGQHERTGQVVPSVIRPARVITWKFAP